MIELDSLTRRFGDQIAVDGVSLRVERGECLVLLGGSGCGKTTTLKMVNRLVEPSAGHVRIDGEDTRGIEAHALRRRIGYAFQRVGLFPHMSVAENVAVTPKLLGWSDDRIERRVDAVLETMELDPAIFRERRTDELSGGQQQRVGLARALAAEPEIVLLDEPFGALDPITRDRLQQSFVNLRQRLAPTVIFVTHDMVEALLLGDRIAVLEAGRLIQLGEPRELLQNPANETVAELMDAPRRHTRVFESLLDGSPGATRV